MASQGKEFRASLAGAFKECGDGRNCAKDPSPFGSEIMKVDEKTPHYFKFLGFNPLIYNISGKYIN